MKLRISSKGASTLHISHVMYTRVMKTLLEERGSIEDNNIVGESCDKT